MYLLRALFWTGVLALFVPFKSFDLARGDIRVDRPALMSELKALPSYCDHRADVCRKAGEVAALMRKDGEMLVGEILDRDNLRRMAGFAHQTFSADQDLMGDERAVLRMRP